MDVSTLSSVNSVSDGKSTKSEGSCSLTSMDFNSFKVTWSQEVRHNKETWKSQAATGETRPLSSSANPGMLLLFRTRGPFQKAGFTKNPS